jgi:flagellar hook-length control protein FliK
VSAASPAVSPSSSPAAQAQAPSSLPSPSDEASSSGAADATLVLGTLAKKAAKDANAPSDPNADAPVTISVTDINAAAMATAASSTAAAIVNIHGAKTAEPDTAASGVATQAAPPPADPSADQSSTVAAQPVAVPMNVPVNVVPAVTVGSGSGNDSGTGQDAALIAALGNAAKAGALGADAAKGNGPATDTRTGGTKPGAKAADAAAPPPSLTPQPTPTDLNSLAGGAQRNAADGTPSQMADGNPAKGAAADRARQQAANSQPTDGTTPPQANSNVDSNVDPNTASKIDLAGTTSRIEDITRQALDPAARHLEAAAADAAGGAAHPGSEQAGAAQSPDGSIGLIAPAALTTAAAPTAAATTTATPTAIPIAGLAVEIASRAHAGQNHFEIRLEPQELGRIDVRLDIDREGKVTSRLIVDRPETLDLLRRDAPQLERSLQQAGLKTADDALQFSLRDQNQGQGGFGNQNPYSNNGSPAGVARVIVPDQELPLAAAPTVAYSRVSAVSAGIDIRV